ncbi:hypothetical protein [Microbacterium sp. EST19A]|uniref:hypothetical protein n=1 Tax=Microbacterium sp. EST19A TaxID=2862681 RepID=UPI001CBB23E6|nr:hypothetical protein [Microbacterium sp. EST19A]
MAKDAATQAKADKNDLLTAIVVGALVIGVLIYDSVQRLGALFGTAGAVTVTAPIPSQTITATIGDGAPATTDMATLVVGDVNLISVICLVLAIVLRGLCLIGVAALGVVLCRRLLGGVVFDQLNARLTLIMSMGLLAAGLAGPWFENMGLNGVFAALGGDFEDARWLLFRDGIPLFVAAIAVGVLVIVFRRGTRLEKETEGLV